MKLARFAILLAVSILLSGCTFLLHPINSTFARHSNPIAGWRFCWSQDPNKRDKAIRDDYQDYINKLPPKKRNYVGSVFFFEDGAGQQAVQIEIDLDGTRWEHVLIYDKNNKRVKEVKYVA